MAQQVIQSVWLPLAIMGYLLVTVTLSVLTSARKNSLDIHDRVRECMELRKQYMQEQSEDEIEV